MRYEYITERIDISNDVYGMMVIGAEHHSVQAMREERKVALIQSKGAEGWRFVSEVEGVLVFEREVPKVVDEALDVCRRLVDAANHYALDDEEYRASDFMGDVAEIVVEARRVFERGTE